MLILREGKKERFPSDYTFKNLQEFWEFIVHNDYEKKVSSISVRSHDGREIDLLFAPQGGPYEFRLNHYNISFCKNSWSLKIGTHLIKSIYTTKDDPSGVDNGVVNIETKNLVIVPDFKVK